MKFSNKNSDFIKPKTLQTLQWMFGWHHEKTPKTPATGMPVPFVNNDGKLLRAAAHDTLTWIGQSSFLIQLGGTNILIDPVLSQSLGIIKRNAPPGLNWQTLPSHIDIVLITHNHRDHMDKNTLMRLGPNPIYVVPRGLGQWFIHQGLTRVIEMNWWENIVLNEITIDFVPTQHWSRRSLNDINTSWWGGFVLSHNGIKIYHCGDSGWFDGFHEIAQKHPNIDVALLPVGAYAPRWFMRAQHIDPQQAIDLYKLLGAKHFVGMHWGTFKLSDEPVNEAQFVLPQLWEQAQLEPRFLHSGVLGETLDLAMLAKG